jgi:hypothetical protein
MVLLLRVAIDVRILDLHEELWSLQGRETEPGVESAGVSSCEDPSPEALQFLMTHDAVDEPLR